MYANNTDYRFESRTCPLSCFASTNSSFVTRNHQKQGVRNSGIHQNYKIFISISHFTANQMAQQGRQMRVGSGEGFAYHLVKLVLLADGNRYEVDSNTFFLCQVVKLYPFEVLPGLNSDLFDPHSYLVVYGSERESCFSFGF